MATNSANPTVLIIDDDETISGAMSRALTLAGYEVSVAATGKAGLEQAFGAHPDLVILDYTIPGTDGLQVLDKLRADMWGHGAKVIFATNVYDVGVVNEAMRLGVSDYVMKVDLSIDQFVALVGKYVKPPAQAEPAPGQPDEQAH
ncbi:response regulator [Candidatus Saccharibacteria bacterium]|nr:MAG: response regulator [Candidatus Saccharibacteria bacterium]